MIQQYTVTPEQDFLLGRECALSAMSIGQGLTLIRKYDFVKHAYGTQAFFMLSVGLERLLKVIHIYEHRRTHNNKFPENADLKNIGHKIKLMYNKAIQIANGIEECKMFQNLQVDPIYGQIISFIDDFAHKSRYYNLDTLTGRNNNTGEPLGVWDEKINRSIVERHYKYSKQKAENIKEKTKNIGIQFLVSFNREDGTEINNLKDLYLEGMTVDVKQKYSMFYVFCIVRFLSYLIWYLDKGYHPLVSEYFSLFRQPDDNYIKSKKTWNLYEI